MCKLKVLRQLFGDHSGEEFVNTTWAVDWRPLWGGCSSCLGRREGGREREELHLGPGSDG